MVYSVIHYIRITITYISLPPHSGKLMEYELNVL